MRVAVRVRPLLLLLPLPLFESREEIEGRWKVRSVSRFDRCDVLVVGDVDGIASRWRYCDGFARDRHGDDGLMRRLRCRGSTEGLILCSRVRISDSDVGSMA